MTLPDEVDVFYNIAGSVHIMELMHKLTHSQYSILVKLLPEYGLMI